MAIPKKLHELVSRFNEHREAYTSGHYKEAQVRQDFIDPFFKLLGWDVDNEQSYAEQYRDVIYEDAIKVGGQTKAPDYGFRIGGVTKFYLEAKKPSVRLKDEVAPAFQLRRYAWTAKLPLSILTDFEEFAVYDCRIRPAKTDKASTGRVMYLECTEYEKKWDEIASIFSREAILKGSFDKYVASTKRKRGTAEVDDAFLKEIEEWRNLLARNVALRNPKLSQRELNFVVQRTIDRIIFLRICEDRGIEQYGRLLALRNGTNVYQRICELFRSADDRYNSGLFHFRKEKGRTDPPDTLTLSVNIDDKPLKDIIRGIYYPDSPYEFSVFPADILGHVYEQFLGKVIRLTAGHRAKVEEKPEVRKAGGVYYTPTYIVDYIVKNTVGKLLEDKRPGPRGSASKLRILDPACGSGSFLIGAYQYLLDWHRDQYIADGAKKHKKVLYQGLGGEWRLTTEEKKRILLNNIYGVDIDPQAVEVTKLSLLLKVLEGENEETIKKQLKLFHTRALPDLSSNIKCGNSLIGPDFYDKQRELFDEEERYRINAFDWGTEFPEIMKNGGFDAVIGNPPWGADVQESEKPYLKNSYRLNTGKYESYIFFIEKATGLLTQNGLFGFIVPSYWISRSQTDLLKSHLCGILWPVSLIIFPENMFKNVRMDSCIILASQNRPQHVHVAEIQKDELFDIVSANQLDLKCTSVLLKNWLQKTTYRFNPRISSQDMHILEKIENIGINLGNIAEISQGLTLYRRSTLIEKYGKARAEEILSKRLFHSDHKKDHTFKKELLGRDVSRYSVEWNGKSWVSYGPWLAHAVDERFFLGPRLVIQKLRNPILKQRLIVGFLDDDETYSAGVLLNAISKNNSPYSLLYLMCVLNSKLLNYWYRKSILDVSIRVVDLNRVPIRSIDFSNSSDRAQHGNLVTAAEQMLNLQKKVVMAKAMQTKSLLQREIETTDNQIDQIVYELYGLTEEEIKIVEESTM